MSDACQKAYRGEFCDSDPYVRGDTKVSWVLLEKLIRIEPPQCRCANGHTLEDHEKMGWTCDSQVSPKPDFKGPIRFRKEQ